MASLVISIKIFFVNMIIYLYEKWLNSYYHCWK